MENTRKIEVQVKYEILLGRSAVIPEDLQSTLEEKVFNMGYGGNSVWVIDPRSVNVKFKLK